MKPFTYFSTFSGIGGFEVGIERAAVSVWNGKTENTKPTTYEQGMEPTSEGLRHNRNITNTEFWGNSGKVSCVGFSEIDKYASSVYEYHFPGVKNYGDITKINEKELPDFDCLVGGFPCQAFSIAGKRGGFSDTRGTFFFDLARILKEKQPRLFVFENVKGLLSHDEGRTIRTIISTLDELGYDCQWQVLNSKNHGVPQNRERIYIVGHLRGTPRPEVFPITGTHGKAAAAGSRDKVAIPVLTPDRIVKRQNGRRFKTDGEPAFTVNTQDRHGILTLVDGAQTERVYSQDGISPTLGTMQGGNQQPKIEEDMRIRKLTPKECERLQGFLDDWTRYGFTKPYQDYRVEEGDNMLDHSDYVKEISDTQRYKMCGNAVTTNVVQAVFERIFNGEA